MGQEWDMHVWVCPKCEKEIDQMASKNEIFKPETLYCPYCDSTFIRLENNNGTTN